MEGNPGKGALHGPGVAAHGRPVMPGHLDEYAAIVWNRIITALPESLFSSVDTELLASYCTAASLHREAVSTIQREGAVVDGSQGQPVQSPWIAILNKQAELMTRIGSRLGLDPATRQAMTMPEEKPASKFAGLSVIGGAQKKSATSSKS